MRITNFMCCHSVTATEDGLVNIEGAGVTQWTADGYPAKLDMTIYAQTIADVNDLEGRKKARLRLMGPTGWIKPEVELEFLTSPENPNPTLFLKTSFYVGSGGNFRYVLTVDNHPETSAAWPLYITRRK